MLFVKIDLKFVYIQGFPSLKNQVLIILKVNWTISFQNSFVIVYKCLLLPYPHTFLIWNFHNIILFFQISNFLLFYKNCFQTKHKCKIGFCYRIDIKIE